MALRIVTGFEFGTTAGWTTGLTAARIVSSVAGSPSIVSSGAVRSGTYALEISAAGAAERVVWDTNLIGSDQSRGRAVFAIRFVGSLPSADITLATFGGTNAGTIFGFQNSSDRFTAQVEGGSVVTGPVVSADTWYVVELYYDGSSTSATFDWWVDGSAQTQATATIGGVEALLNFALGTADASTYTARYDDLVLYTDTAAISGPVGAHKVVILTPDTGGSLDVSTINTAEWNTFAGATPTLSAWNATTALGAIDEIPVGLGTSADGFCRITGTDADYVGIPMTSYTLAAGESITGLRMLACAWAASGTACTHSFASYNGTTATTLQAAADIGTDNSATAPAWVCKICTAADFDTQSELDALQFRFGSTDSTPDAGIHAIYAELAVKEAGGVNVDGNREVTADRTGTAAVDRPVDGNRATTADRTGTAAVDRPVSGDQAVTADIAGTIDVVTPAVEVDGSLAATADRVGTAAVDRPAAGTLSITADRTGAAAVERPVSGDQVVTVDRAGTAAVERPVSGDLAATADIAGAIDVVHLVEADGTLAVATDRTGTATVDQATDGTLPITAAPAGTAAVDRPAAGDLTVTIDRAGTAAVDRPVSGTQPVTATLTGSIDVDQPGQANVEGTLAVAATLTGAATVVGVADGDLNLAATIIGTAQVIAQASGDLAVTAAITGAADVPGAAGTTRMLAGLAPTSIQTAAVGATVVATAQRVPTSGGVQ